jgi:coproporphyrinogen III oxidase
MGSGGLTSPEGLDQAQAFCEAVAEGWMPSWLPLCAKRRALPYTEAQRDWQLQRRGRCASEASVLLPMSRGDE